MRWPCRAGRKVSADQQDQARAASRLVGVALFQSVEPHFEIHFQWLFRTFRQGFDHELEHALRAGVQGADVAYRCGPAN